ncbi:hypothetical protein [Sulfuricella sp.]|uniref:hypothetical protein n=1 Tax=Sulfuricella sp. TaxID=2099377 RepID=UPI002C3FB3B8|nr:hypothetical protein [Sulfuricella sp.]HUX64328.1 hypothetical protein [Sulfuricella sp.]
MTEPRVTVRFPESEIKALSQRAAALGVGKAEYIRFAVGASIQQEKIEDKIGTAIDQLSSQIANFQAREAKLWRLLLRFQNAPEKAVEMLEKIIELHAGVEQ